MAFNGFTRLMVAHMAVLSLVVLGSVAFAAGSRADDNGDFDVWLTGVREEGISRGISPAILDAALAGLAPIPRIIELDRGQPESTITFAHYLDRVVTRKRISKGRDRVATYGSLLGDVTKAYGVPGRFIVALWGIETNFGQYTGGFSVVAALATLAHDGRRSAYFRKELLLALEILDQGHIGVDSMKGSWAGAMGQSQFMPSSFLNYAVDYDGDGKRDIWTTKADVFGSAANYLSGSGWRSGETWGREASLPAGFDPTLISMDVAKPLAAWQALGVRRADGRNLPAADLMASLVLPGGEGGPVFLVYENYRTILKWNRSHYFAMAVGHLANAIGASSAKLAP